MKAVKLFQNIGLVLTFGLFFSAVIFAQAENPKTRERVTKNEEKTETKTQETKPVESVKSDDKTVVAETTSGDEQEVLTYYNNYLKEYRLGPNDVISVEVFGQCPDYCKTGITVPPTARISYPLVREGVLVGGKTVEQVADEITRKLDEYIIEPKVTVTLDKAMSARYSVMGKVSAPGIRILDRKVSLYEAVIEAGGVTKEGNKKKIALVRFDPQGKLVRQEVNLADIESGKAPMIYLNPGDQVFVPGKGFTIDTIFKTLEKVSIVRLLFGSPF
jgi:polysaccharide export outer membrane protein